MSVDEQLDRAAGVIAGHWTDQRALDTRYAAFLQRASSPAGGRFPPAGSGTHKLRARDDAARVRVQASPGHGWALALTGLAMGAALVLGFQHVVMSLDMSHRAHARAASAAGLPGPPATGRPGQLLRDSGSLPRPPVSVP